MFNLSISMIMMMSAITLMMLVSSNLVFKWVLSEISSILMIYCLSKNSSSIASIFYYMVSGLSMIVFVLMILKKSGSGGSIFLNIMLQILMFLKLGIFPFSNWLICSYEFMSWSQIFLMSSFMKIIPIILFKEMHLSQELIFLLVLCSFIVSIESIKYFSMKKLFACSSSVQNFIFLILIYSSKQMFVIYVIFYILLLYSIVYFLELNKVFCKYDLHKLTLGSSIMYMILIVAYMFIPPLAMFMLKWMFMFNVLFVSDNSIWLILLVYMFSNLLMMWNYFSLIKMPNFFPKLKSFMKFSNLNFLSMYLLVAILFIIFGSMFMSMY